MGLVDWRVRGTKAVTQLKTKDSDFAQERSSYSKRKVSISRKLEKKWRFIVEEDEDWHIWEKDWSFTLPFKKEFCNFPTSVCFGFQRLELICEFVMKELPCGVNEDSTCSRSFNVKSRNHHSKGERTALSWEIGIFRNLGIY